MPYVDKISPEDADGLLDRIFQARTKSAGIDLPQIGTPPVSIPPLWRSSTTPRS